MSKTWTLLVALLVGAGMLVGCGGDDDDAGADAAAEAADEAEQGVDDDVDLDDVEDFAFGSEECLEASAAFLSAAGGAAALFGGGDEELERSLAELQELGDDVPDEIADDFDVFVEVYADLADELADLDYDPSSGEAPDDETMAALQELGERFEDSDFQAASDRIQAWFTENCEMSDAG
ncbi:MAG TPA: hypothetical protein VFU93_12940 [Acidimicrobiales bacterium]|nr:hypothetical protein [Acidimicrobiales bacterium]